MTKLSDILASRPASQPFHTYEFFPPRTASGFSNLLDRIQRLCASPLCPPLAISVTWGAGGSTALRSLELAGEIMKMRLGAEGVGGEGRVQVILHLTCTNMGKKMVDEALKKCKELGIQNILALRGDPPRAEEYRITPQPEITSFSSHPGPAPDTKTSSSDGAKTAAETAAAEAEAETEELELDASELLDPDGSGGDEEYKFEYAEDLVRYIRREWGGWFCVGVAGYPTPHPDSTSPASDIHYLHQKVLAGADFILTQLFYDVPGFLSWVKTVRDAGIEVPIIPGIMPIQNFASFRRLTNLCKCPVPMEVLQELEPIKADDALVKRYGIQLATRMVNQILAAENASIPGVHFCTLNLEKSVRTVLENLAWTTSSPNPGPTTPLRNKLIEQDGATVPNQAIPGSSPSNRMQALSISPSDASHLAEHGLKARQQPQPKSDKLSVPIGGPIISAQAAGSIMNDTGTGSNTNGTGTGGGVPDAQDSWDEYPNGRFTDVRSPAYGEIDGYGGGLKITPNQALKEWGAPVDAESLSTLFISYLRSKPNTPTTPFCDLPISPESENILTHLIHLNSPTIQKWTVGSQPAVDGAKSEDPIYGFGPKGGWIFQKAFVEFFVRDGGEVRKMMEKIKKDGDGLISFYAGNRAGDFLTNLDDDAVNAVTWAAFPGQEIVQSTIIEKESFLAWKEEAFEIWTEWSHLYPTRSASRKLLADTADKAWLMSVIHHDYKDPEALWRFVVGEGYKAGKADGAWSG